MATKIALPLRMLGHAPNPINPATTPDGMRASEQMPVAATLALSVNRMKEASHGRLPSESVIQNSEENRRHTDDSLCQESLEDDGGDESRLCSTKDTVVESEVQRAAETTLAK